MQRFGRGWRSSSASTPGSSRSSPHRDPRPRYGITQLEFATGQDSYLNETIRSTSTTSPTRTSSAASDAHRHHDGRGHTVTELFDDSGRASSRSSTTPSPRAAASSRSSRPWWRSSSTTRCLQRVRRPHQSIAGAAVQRASRRRSRSPRPRPASPTRRDPHPLTPCRRPSHPRQPEWVDFLLSTTGATSVSPCGRSSPALTTPGHRPPAGQPLLDDEGADAALVEEARPNSPSRTPARSPPRPILLRTSTTTCGAGC